MNPSIQSARPLFNACHLNVTMHSRLVVEVIKLSELSFERNSRYFMRESGYNSKEADECSNVRLWLNQSAIDLSNDTGRFELLYIIQVISTYTVGISIGSRSFRRRFAKSFADPHKRFP